jgi:hypothetical protein
MRTSTLREFNAPLHISAFNLQRWNQELQVEHGRITHEVVLLRKTVKQLGLEGNFRALFVSNRIERLFAKHCVKEERTIFYAVIWVRMSAQH